MSRWLLALLILLLASPACGQVPPGVTGVTVEERPFPSLRLDWQDNSSDETGFRIERSTDGGNVFEVTLPDVPANAMRYVDTSVLVDTQYCYRLLAFSATAQSAYSNVACGVSRSQPGPRMSVAFDAKPTVYNSADGLNQEVGQATSITAASGFTIGVGATLLVVVAHLQIQNDTNGAITGLSGTWDGVSLIVAGSASNSGGGSNRSALNAILYLVNPTPGTKTLALSWAQTADCYMSAVSFTGSDLTTPIVVAHTVTGTAGTTVTITSDANGATVASWGIDGATPTVNFTKIYAEAPFSPGGGASYTLGGSSNAHTFTGAGGTQPAWVGVHVNPAAAGGGRTTKNTRSNPLGVEIGMGWQMPL